MDRKKKTFCDGGHKGSNLLNGGKYCPNCGEIVNPQATVVPNCQNFHQEYGVEFKFKFCPECGKKL